MVKPGSRFNISAYEGARLVLRVLLMKLYDQPHSLKPLVGRVLALFLFLSIVQDVI